MPAKTAQLQSAPANSTAHWSLLCPPVELIGDEWLLACTPDGQAASPSAQSFEWRPLLSHSPMLHARVPVGQLAHADGVLAGTVVSVATASLGLLCVLWRTPKPM